MAELGSSVTLDYTMMLVNSSYEFPQITNWRVFDPVQSQWTTIVEFQGDNITYIHPDYENSQIANGSGPGAIVGYLRFTATYSLNNARFVVISSDSREGYAAESEFIYLSVIAPTPTPTLTPTPTQTPTSTPTPTQIGYNYANYNRVADWNGQDGNLTTVGTNGGPSYYGTLDQSGNVWEWNEAASGTSRCIRGGSWVSVAPSVDFQTFYISKSYRTFYGVSNRSYDVGFRVASSLNPLSISNFVSVGDVLGSADTTTYGSVNYAYQISKYTVTQSQYVVFLNAVASTDTYGLYSTDMASESRGGITRSSVSGSYLYSFKDSMGGKPVNFVNWLACARYCNWLHNGRPTGLQNASTTENGAYAISGTSATKISGASYWIPTENEWYKAAYFSMAKNGGLGGYWKYATQSDADPTPVSSNPTGDGPFVPA